MYESYEWPGASPSFKVKVFVRWFRKLLKGTFR